MKIEFNYQDPKISGIFKKKFSQFFFFAKRNMKLTQCIFDEF